MRKGWIPVLVVIALMVTAVIALARGAPPGRNDQAIVSVDVAPAVAGGSPMTVVIQDIAVSSVGSAQEISDTSAQVRQSTTVAERGSRSVKCSNQSRLAPRLVLLA